MQIFLGTLSTDKLAYLESIVSDFLPEQKIIPVSVESGVGDQPIGLAEIRLGADNRAQRAYLSDQNSLVHKIGVGMEAGLVLNDAGIYELICVTSIFDGEFYRGASSGLALPKEVSDKILLEKAEFGVQIRKYQPETGEQELVSELISREKSFKTSIKETFERYYKIKKTI